jgi:hypothetical protein
MFMYLQRLPLVVRDFLNRSDFDRVSKRERIDFSTELLVLGSINRPVRGLALC